MIYLLQFLVYAIAVNTALALRGYRGTNPPVECGRNRYLSLERPEESAVNWSGSLWNVLLIYRVCVQASQDIVKTPETIGFKGDKRVYTAVETAMKDQPSGISRARHSIVVLSASTRYALS